MRKIKAYSFIELMVVMVMSTITIAIAYQGYILFYKQFLSFKKMTEQNSGIIQLDAILHNDFSTSKEVRKNKDGVNCLFMDKTIFYLWTDSYIIRKQSTMVDTFKMEVSDLKFTLNSREAFEGELVDEIKFVGNKELYFLTNKTYGADVLINAELSVK